MQINLPVDAHGREIRARDAKLSVEDAKLQGYAVLYNTSSVDLGGWRERFAPGAFTDSLRDYPDIFALWQHNTDQVLGRTAAGTLTINEDQNGIAFTIEPPDTQAGRDAVALIKRGDVSQMSFAFSVNENGSKWEKIDGVWVRTVLSARLYEVSPVTWPAYPQTSVTAHSLTITLPDDHPLSLDSRARLEALRLRLDLIEKIQRV